MLIVMKAHATEEDVRRVCERIETLGFRAHSMPGAQRTAIGITGNETEIDPGSFDEMAGVQEVIRVSKPYKLVSRDLKEDDTVLRFPNSDATIGGAEVAVMAGPCAIESRQQAFTTAGHVARAGARFFRGGAYKPRTSPYAFQGLAEDGLKILADIRDQFGLLIVTEAVDNESLDLVEKYADMIQIGARNMQNFSLLKRAGRARKPVMLKRGMSATLEEFLMAAEYIMSEGNYNVVLCERGVRTFADHTRNTLDLSVVPAVQRLSHLPIIVDPSHGTGKRNKVTPLSRAAVAVGADGLIIEVHPDPDRALERRQAVALSRSVRPVDGRDSPDRQRARPLRGRHRLESRGPPSRFGCGQRRNGCRSIMPVRTPWRSSARWNALLSLLLFAAILPACHQDKTVAPGYHEYAYVSNGKSNSVSVIDLLQLRNVKTITVGAGPTGVAASPTRNEIYVANADSNNVSIIDAERNQVVATHWRSRQAVLCFGFVRWQAGLRRQLRFGKCFRNRSGETSGHRDHSRRRRARSGQGFGGRQAGGRQQSRRRYRLHHRRG